MSRATVFIAFILATAFFTGPPAFAQENGAAAHSGPEHRPVYSNSSGGLRKLFQDALAAAKDGDNVKLAGFVKEMEIPDYEAWFTKTFGQEKGESWAGPYGKELAANEASFRQLFREHAGKSGFIATRSVNDWPERGNDLEKSMTESPDRQHLDTYYAEWRPDEPGKAVEFIGYFYFLEGKFRWDGTIKVMKLVTVGASQASPGTSATAIRQSISGNQYRNETAHFSLTVPDGWLANDVLAKTSSSLGAVTSPDGKEQFVVQQMLVSVSPAELAGAMDAQGPATFLSYRKVGQSELTIADKKCAVLNIRFSLSQAQAGMGAGLPLAAWIVLIPAPGKILMIEFVTVDSLFDQAEPVFESIIKSYASIDEVQ